MLVMVALIGCDSEKTKDELKNTNNLTVTKETKTTAYPVSFANTIDTQTKTNIHNMLESQPIKGTNYYIQIVPPDSKLKYKILETQPDPSKNYKIRVIDPSTQKDDTEMSRKIQDIIKEKNVR
jgi:hypothetical protein